MAEINLKLGDIKEALPERIVGKFRRRAFEKVNLYPGNYDTLIEKLAQKHKVRPENIVLVNGVDEGIELIVRVFGQDILVFSPTYYEFVDAPKRNGLKYETINCFDGKKYALKFRDEDVKNRSLIFLCNPNNPFGILSKEEIVALARKTKAIVAVDETYIDFNGETAIRAFESTPNILVMRSFSKSFSLAGLRIGYVVGEKALIDKIRQRKLICNVTSVSVNAAMTALGEEKYFKALIAKIKKRKDAFETFFKKKGFDVIHTYTNNIVIKFQAKQETDAFYKFLKSKGIIANQGNGISTCGLDDTFVRFSCGTKEQMKKVKKIISSKI